MLLRHMLAVCILLWSNYWMAFFTECKIVLIYEHYVVNLDEH